MKRELLWKIIIPTILSVISIYLSIKFNLSSLEAILVGIQIFITVLLLEILYDNYDAKKEQLLIKDANFELIKLSELYKKNFLALTNPNPLFRKFLIAQYNNYDEFLSDASRGVVRLRSKHNLLMYYGEFYECANEGSLTCATTITVPKREWFEPVLSANKKYIKERGGKVIRIFIISPDDFKDSEKQSRIIEFMERQKSINVDVKYASTESLDDSLFKDLTIVDNPPMANLAYPSPTGEYFEADLITNEKKLQEIKRIWDNLIKLYAIDFNSKEELLKYFQII